MKADDAILELGKLVEAPAADEVGGDFDLALGALLIASTDAPDVDIEGVLGNLDRMAAAASNRIPDDGNELQQLNAVTDLLFGVIGFSGNRDDYYDPRNSYLNHVLDRRLGIPITLSLLCIEVGRRAGVPILGIGIPGHFVIRHRGRAKFLRGLVQRGIAVEPGRMWGVNEGSGWRRRQAGSSPPEPGYTPRNPGTHPPQLEGNLLGPGRI